MSIDLEDNAIEAEGEKRSAKQTKKTTDLWEEAEKLVGAEQYMVKLGGHVLKRKINTHLPA